MAEPTPSPSAPVPPARKPPRRRRRISWRRVRLYTLGILLIFAIYLYAAARILREHPYRVARELLALLPYPSSVAHVTWISSNQLEFRDVKIGDFFYAARITITASPYQLLRHHIDEVDIRGGQFFTKPFDDALRRGVHSGGGANIDWTISRLVIYRGTLMLQDLAPDMPAIPIRLGIAEPIILNYVKLGRPDESPSMNRERTIEIQNVLVVSPFDPLAPVLSFPLTRVRFTYKELWHHQLREVELVRPVIHLGQDLFWFSDQFKKDRASHPPNTKGVDAPWHVGQFEVHYGQLAINAFGQPAITFPFFFDTSVNNIRLDQLDKISARTVIPFRRFDANYTDYKIKIRNLEGHLEFSVPPSDAKANNVVPTIHIDSLSWNNIAATDVYASVTFDPTGIYGKLSGHCEKGLLNSNFEVYYTQGFRWNADFFATTIDCAPIADKLAGKYGTLTGTIDGEIGVQGQATNIERVKGSLDLKHPGELDIRSADDLLKHLPGASGSLQNQSLKLAVDALRTYPYETGGMDVDYHPGEGRICLKLAGPRGKRDFSVYFHPYQDETSKVANAHDNR